MFLKIHLFRIDRGRRGFEAGGSGGELRVLVGGGRVATPAQFISITTARHTAYLVARWMKHLASDGAIRHTC